jgi:hypothetical protein
MKKLLFLLSIFYISSAYSQDSIGGKHANAFFDNVYLSCNYSPLFITSMPDNAFNHQKVELGGTFFHSFSSNYQLGLVLNLFDFMHYRDIIDGDIIPQQYDPRFLVNNSYSRLEHEIGIKNRLYLFKDLFADISLGYTFCSLYRTDSKTYFFNKKATSQNMFFDKRSEPISFIDFSLGYKFLNITYSIKNTSASLGMENYVGIGFQFKL